MLYETKLAGLLVYVFSKNLMIFIDFPIDIISVINGLKKIGIDISIFYCSPSGIKKPSCCINSFMLIVL